MCAREVPLRLGGDGRHGAQRSRRVRSPLHHSPPRAGGGRDRHAVWAMDRRQLSAGALPRGAAGVSARSGPEARTQLGAAAPGADVLVARRADDIQRLHRRRTWRARIVGGPPVDMSTEGVVGVERSPHGGLCRAPRRRAVAAAQSNARRRGAEHAVDEMHREAGVCPIAAHGAGAFAADGMRGRRRTNSATLPRRRQLTDADCRQRPRDELPTTPTAKTRTRTRRSAGPGDDRALARTSRDAGPRWGRSPSPRTRDHAGERSCGASVSRSCDEAGRDLTRTGGARRARRGGRSISNGAGSRRRTRFACFVQIWWTSPTSRFTPPPACPRAAGPLGGARRRCLARHGGPSPQAGGAAAATTEPRHGMANVSAGTTRPVLSSVRRRTPGDARRRPPPRRRASSPPAGRRMRAELHRTSS